MRWRLMNSPTCVPMAVITFKSASSGAPIWRPNSVTTPQISPSERIGNASAPFKPARAAGVFNR